MGTKINPSHILVARTDSIGDVMLTLPLVTFLKNYFSGIKISFLGQSYTRPVLECCGSIDEIYEWNKIKELPAAEQVALFRSIGADTIIHVFPDKAITKLAKRSGIKNRIATSHRLFTWFTCNYRVSFDRKNSDLHESQLNFKLLHPFGIDTIPGIDEISSLYNFNAPHENNEMKKMRAQGKFNLILHPKSKGSAREWNPDNFNQLIHLLPENQFEIFISGVKDDSDIISKEFSSALLRGNVHSIAGKFSLQEFISFIDMCDGLIAASTGPLHIAAALGKKAIGLFVPLRPMHPGRWKPVGKNAFAITGVNSCSGCPGPADCTCMESITPEMVFKKIIQDSSGL